MKLFKKFNIDLLFICLITLSEQSTASAEILTDETFYENETSKITVHLDSLNNQVMRITAKHTHREPITIDFDRFINLHEAAHAVAFICKSPSEFRVQSIDKGEDLTCGHNRIEKKYPLLIESNINKLENTIIASLIGSVCEQINLGFQQLNETDMEKYFRKLPYLLDRYQTNITKKIIKEISEKTGQPHRSLFELYKESYQFCLEHQTAINKLADALTGKKSLSKDEIYAILEQDVPLTDIEQGPLPQSLQDDYQYRQSTEIIPLYNKDTFTIDPRKDHTEQLANKHWIEKKYYMNDNIAITIERYSHHNDSTEMTIQTQYNMNGNPIATIYMPHSNIPDGHTITCEYDDQNNKISSVETMSDKSSITTLYNNKKGIQTIENRNDQGQLVSTSIAPIIQPSILAEPTMERYSKAKLWMSKGIETSPTQKSAQHRDTLSCVLAR